MGSFTVHGGPATPPSEEKRQRRLRYVSASLLDMSHQEPNVRAWRLETTKYVPQHLNFAGPLTPRP